MAPSSSPLHPASSQGKKQQSISTFFKPKSAPAGTNATPKPSISAPVQRVTTSNANDPELFLSSDEDGLGSPDCSSRRNKRAVDGDTIEGLPELKKARQAGGGDSNEGAENGTGSKGDLEHAKTQLHHGGASSTVLNAPREPKISERTSKYLFSSSPAQFEDQHDDEDGKAKRQKESLHEKFVKKLGRPDSFAEIKRRKHLASEEAGEDEDGAEDDEAGMQDATKPAGKSRKNAGAKKGGSKLTPMEKQIVEIKREHADTILVVEVGYKYRFFGEDARIAAKELGIVCIPGKFRYDEHPSEAHLDKFASASFPTHRLHVHVKRLVQAGHKVGVVRQLETAALKAAGDNRNAPFVRKLTNLYTKGTYIDDTEALQGPASESTGGAPASGYLLCLTETKAKGWGTDEKVHVGFVAVQPATGDVVYDDFEDGFMRSEIETRLLHIAPCEFLIVGELSKATEKLIKHLSTSKSNVFGDQARIERVEKPKTVAAQSYDHVSNFYADKIRLAEDAPNGAFHVLDKVHQLSELVTICLSAMISHLTEYGLEHVFDLTKYFQPFSARSHMLLNGNTLTSLEIYRNQTEYTEKGSLFWTMDRTKTRFGRRLLRKWVGRPLLDKAQLEARVAAVEELKEGSHATGVEKLRYLLSQVKTDLEKSLIRIYYRKCSRPELLAVLQTLQRIASEYEAIDAPEKSGFSSPIIGEAIASLPTISADVLGYLEKINPQAAKDDDKYAFFRDDEETEEITEHKLGIAAVEHELNEHRKEAAQKVRKSKVDYVTVAGIEYLIEIDNSQLKSVPASWIKVSGTKKVSRFHTPEVLRLIRERDQHKEALAAACDSAFSTLLGDISSKYHIFRDCIQSLAVLDCLLSLADLASQPGYVKPTITSEPKIDVDGGRHPMVEQLLLDAYVPNSIRLAQDPSSAPRALLVTGPNMGGKSSYVRSVALISIMAQIGSYVPAERAELSLLDAVFTRMGAFDNMMKGESTFMVELSETSDILKQATPRSLVILDELGRGTSTHDGVAIASAVLDYVVRELKCFTLFITHYQNLATTARAFPAGELKNVHMRFEERGGSGKEITFLYEVAEGTAHRSYGLNVARLANVPEPVLDVAAVKSAELEQTIRGVMVRNMSRMLLNVVKDSKDGYDTLEELLVGIEHL